MLLLHYYESTTNLTKSLFAFESPRDLAKFMQILGLGRTRRMYDVSVTYLYSVSVSNEFILRRLYDECVAFDAMA